MSRQSSIEESIQKHETLFTSHSPPKSPTVSKSFDIQQEENEKYIKKRNQQQQQQVVCQPSDLANNNNNNNKNNVSSTIVPTITTTDITTTLTTLTNTTTTTTTTINDITTKTKPSKGLFKKISIKVIEWIRNSLAQGKDVEVGKKILFLCVCVCVYFCFQFLDRIILSLSFLHCFFFNNV